MPEVKIITLTEKDLLNKVSLQESLEAIHRLTHYGITKAGSTAYSAMYCAFREIEADLREVDISPLKEALDSIDVYFRDIQYIVLSISQALEEERPIHAYEVGWEGIENKEDIVGESTQG